MLDVLRFWLDLGIDGFRLDAVPYLFEREGTNGENLPETHEYLKRVRAEVEARYPDRVLLAEANQWPEDVVDYFGDGDECQMAFHFPVMPRMFMAVRREDATPIYEILDRTPAIPDNCQWGLFLRNHDELTLEMVTDEERDYMYAEYAKDPRMKINLGIRRRLAPLLDAGRDEVELLHAILFSLPGSPVLYYGDEIGMGDNVYLGDRDGVRTPMQWSGDRNAGFSRADWAQLYLQPLMDPVYGFQAVNVEAQLARRTRSCAGCSGSSRCARSTPSSGSAPTSRSAPRTRGSSPTSGSWEEDIVLCVHNLARSAQAVQLDLKDVRGYGARGDARPDALPADRGAAVSADTRAARVLLVPAQAGGAGGVSMDETRLDRVRHATALVRREVAHRLALAGARLRRHAAGRAAALRSPSSRCASTPARTTSTSSSSRATPRTGTRRPREEPRLARELVSAMRTGLTLQGAEGVVEFSAGRRLRRRSAASSSTRGSSAPSSRTRSIVFDDALILKVFRRLEPGINPELEMLRFLTEQRLPRTSPRSAAGTRTRAARSSATLGMLQEYVAGAIDGWELALDEIASAPESVPRPARRLGEVTAQMHTALGVRPERPAFAPEEPSVESLGAADGDGRRGDRACLPVAARRTTSVSRRSSAAARRCASSCACSPTPARAARVIRTHGDYHLGQTL